MRIGIIGGGVSGVSLALKLSLIKKAGKDISVTLLESSKRVGGTIDSAHKDGYVIEAGTNGFLDSKPFTLEVFKEAGLEANLLKSNDSARRRFIQRYNELQLMPEGAIAFLSSRLLSWSGKLRLPFEFFVAKRTDGVDETLESFIKRRLGEEALDYLISPMVSGIFAGDPSKMSIKSSFPVIYDLEQNYGGLIKGLLKKPKKQSGPAGPGGVLTAYVGGMGVAIKDLADVCTKNGVDIKLSAEVSSVTKNDKGEFVVKASDGDYIFDQLAIACPAYASSKFLKGLNAKLSENLGKIKYAPIFVGGFGFNSDAMEDDINGFGYLIPAKENRDILGALFTSSMFPSQAPAGKKFLRVLAGGDRKHELMNKSDAELTEICLKDITDILGVKNKPYMVQTFRYANAIPQYHVGHSEKVKNIEDACEEVGNIYVGGNVLYGIGLNDCTKTSKIIAEKIEKKLKQ